MHIPILATPGGAEPGQDARRGEPLTCGVPFPKGLTRTTDGWTLTDGAGVTQLVQARVLDRWADGSIRWALVDTQADVAGGATALSLHVGPNAPPAPPGGPALRVTEAGGGVGRRYRDIAVSAPGWRKLPVRWCRDGRRAGDRQLAESTHHRGLSRHRSRRQGPISSNRGARRAASGPAADWNRGDRRRPQSRGFGATSLLRGSLNRPHAHHADESRRRDPQRRFLGPW